MFLCAEWIEGEFKELAFDMETNFDQILAKICGRVLAFLAAAAAEDEALPRIQQAFVAFLISYQRAFYVFDVLTPGTCKDILLIIN